MHEHCMKASNMSHSDSAVFILGAGEVEVRLIIRIRFIVAMTRQEELYSMVMQIV